MESDKIGIVSGTCWSQHRPRGDGLRGAMTRITAMGHVEGPCLVNREKDVCITTLGDSVNHITSSGDHPTNRSRLCERTGSIGADIYLPPSPPGGHGPLPPSLLSWSTTSSSSSPPPFCPAAPDRREYTGRQASDAYAELRAAVARTGEGGREEDDI